jgi:hypothetical protein
MRGDEQPILCGMGQQTMAGFVFKTSELDFVCALHGREAPRPGEWSSYCELLRDYFRNNAPERLRGITLTLGGGPDSRQRRELVDTMPQVVMAARGAIITNSTIIRGIVTAFAWLQKSGLQAFQPSDFLRGFAYVGMPSQEVDRFLVEAAACADVIVENPVLRLIRQAHVA